MFTKLFRVGNDPEIRFTPSGKAVLNLSLAYSYGRKGADGSKLTQWIEAALWGNQAEALAPYIKKGDQVSVSIDDLHNEEYEGKNSKGFKMVGNIVKFEFVGGSKSSQNTARSEPSQSNNAGFDDDLDIPF